MSISPLFYGCLYPLQTFKMTDFWKPKGSSTVGAVLFVIGVTVTIAALIIVNMVKKKYAPPALTGALPQSSTDTASRHFSRLVLYRMARRLGLNRKQTQMLEFVLKTDGVTNLKQSINTSALLDQHFRRAYRHFEQDAKSEAETQEQLSLLFSTRNILEYTAGGGSITSTRQLPENISTVLDVKGESYPSRVLSAKGKYLLVENPLDAHSAAVHFAEGSHVTLSFFVETSSSCSFESHVVGVIKAEGGPILRLAHSGEKKQLSLRHFRRRQAAVAARCSFVYLEGKRMMVDKKHFSGSMHDISTGGCAIKTSAPVDPGARLKIEATYGKLTITALGQALRINRSGASGTLHIKFLKVPRKSLNAINAFVYQYIDVYQYTD
jgi:c-di-GMP-binding flagellar brake protein YcgR